MFRKPKRKAKASLRHSTDDNDDTNKDEHDRATSGRHTADDDDAQPDPLRYNAKKDDSDDEETSALLSEVRKRTRPSGKGISGVSGTDAAATAITERSSGAGRDASVMHSYRSTDAPTRPTGAELATRAAEHHAVASSSVPTATAAADGTATRGADGIFRDKTRNAFAAGPIRAQTNVRVTARFDYQPDVCKDYKDTGFCGYGDTCIYLHDRGDSMTGWQLEQQWEEQQKQKQQDQVLQAFVNLHSDGGRSGDRVAIIGGTVPVGTDDGIPFACHICRGAFHDPVVTKCQHYFCEACILQHVREVSEACPICGKDTTSIFNQPNKLLGKKRRLVGAQASWQEFLEKFTAGTTPSSRDRQRAERPL